MKGIPGSSDSKESACNVEELGLILGSERSPGEGNGYPFQYSCLENSIDRSDWWTTVRGIAKSQTWLSPFFHAKWIKTNRDIIYKSDIWYHLYVESAKHNKCEYNKRNRLTDVETKLVVTCEETNAGRDDMGRGLSCTNYYVWNELQGYILQYRKYSQYFTITFKIVHHSTAHL